MSRKRRSRWQQESNNQQIPRYQFIWEEITIGSSSTNQIKVWRRNRTWWTWTWRCTIERNRWIIWPSTWIFSSIIISSFFPCNVSRYDIKGKNYPWESYWKDIYSFSKSKQKCGNKKNRFQPFFQSMDRIKWTQTC